MNMNLYEFKDICLLQIILWSWYNLKVVWASHDVCRPNKFWQYFMMSTSNTNLERHMGCPYYRVLNTRKILLNRIEILKKTLWWIPVKIKNCIQDSLEKLNSKFSFTDTRTSLIGLHGSSGYQIRFMVNFEFLIIYRPFSTKSLFQIKRLSNVDRPH